MTGSKEKKGKILKAGGQSLTDEGYDEADDVVKYRKNQKCP
jgi:hypothetical protein